ncbi:MAG: matrixin family metalloprotease [Myxococcota bacterium]
MRFALVALVLATSGTAYAQGFCRSCTVDRATPIFADDPNSCAQACFCDIDAGERFLFWDRRCLPWAIEAGDPRDVTREVFRTTIARAFARWTNVDCGGETVGFEVQESSEPAPSDVAEFLPGGGNQNAFIFADDWTDRGYAPNAFALTTVWQNPNTGEIFDADIELNEQRWRWAICPEGGCDSNLVATVDLENTLVHEIGHFFGFGHPSAGGDDLSLWACSRPGETVRRDLSLQDEIGMCEVYADQLPNACSFEPRSFDEGCGCRAVGGSERELPLAGLLLVLGFTAWRVRARR